MAAKYIFITGGVVSGLGKGQVTASVGRILKSMGYKVSLQKFDPYINVDPSNMDPCQHGEIFITEDGAEVDHNIGHYERFLNQDLDRNSNVTTGGIYWTVLNKERRGEYHGQTVQVIPHITGEIKNRIYKVARGDVDFVITEIGGTVGDIESQPFLEAIRQVSSEVGSENVIFIHVTLVPYISGSSELKTKPTQHSVKELLSLGIQPHILVCRCGLEITEEMSGKIALFCNIRGEDVIPNLTGKHPYEMPLMLEEKGLASSICYHLGLADKKPDLKAWSDMVGRLKHPKSTVKVGVLAQYAEKHEACLSVEEALGHAATARSVRCEINLISTEDLKQKGAETVFTGLQGVVAVGSFGENDVEAYIEAAKYCREKDIPYLGIGGGLHGMVLDAARNLANITGAGSTEFGECEPVVDSLIDKDSGITPTIRKGLFPCKINENSRVFQMYNDELVYERHYCKYEINPAYLSVLEKAGITFSALSPDHHLVEAAEYTNKKWFIGVQYFFQFSSRPDHPHPIAASFIDTLLK